MNLLRMGSIRSALRSIFLGFFGITLGVTFSGIIFGVMYGSVVAPVAATDFIREISYNLEQPISGKTSVVSAGEYLTLVYQLALGLVGIIAVVIIMFGGLMWVQAAGNEQSISKAKELIVSAVVGLLIALLSYTILAFVNPETLRINFSVSRIPIVDEEDISKLPDCLQAQFTSQTCMVDGIDQPCDEVQCGKKGYYNGDFCRGDACEPELSVPYPICNKKISDPKTYQCQNYKCAEWANGCVDGEYKKYGGDTDQDKIDACLCDYYPQKVLPDFGVPYSSQGESLFTEMTDLALGRRAYENICTRSPQDDNEWYIQLVGTNYGSDPAPYNYSGSPVQAGKGGFNCPQYPACGWTLNYVPSRGQFYKCEPK